MSVVLFYNLCPITNGVPHYKLSPRYKSSPLLWTVPRYKMFPWLQIEFPAMNCVPRYELSPPLRMESPITNRVPRYKTSSPLRIEFPITNRVNTTNQMLQIESPCYKLSPPVTNWVPPLPIKAANRRPEKSRKWESFFFQCMFFCVCISFLVDC